jgi:hypothetical protein
MDAQGVRGLHITANGYARQSAESWSRFTIPGIMMGTYNVTIVKWWAKRLALRRTSTFYEYQVFLIQ